MQRIFHTPEGVRDIYNGECAQKKRLQHKIHDVFYRYGFQDIETPTFEYFEVFSNEVGTIPSKDLYKFFDREGNTLVLRPDFTPSVCRACASYFTPDQEPVGLCYTGNAFINSSSLRGRLKETTQMGVERLGDESAFADAEILSMLIECLIASGLKEFQVSIGQVDYFKSLLLEAGLPDEEEKKLRSLISQKNYFGVEELIREHDMDPLLARVFVELPQLFGSYQTLERAKSLTSNPSALKSVQRLEEIYELLRIYGYEKYICFDFGMLSKYQYYTGIIFHAYTYGKGEPIVKGGRYNELMKHFGTPAAAVGFVIIIDDLLQAINRQNLANDKTPETEVLYYDSDNMKEIICSAQKLREQGKAVSIRPKKEKLQ